MGQVQPSFGNVKGIKWMVYVVLVLAEFDKKLDGSGSFNRRHSVINADNS